MRRMTKLLGLAMMATLHMACTSDDLETTQQPKLNWSACTDNAALDCAIMKVPMNHSDKKAGDIEIALSRLPASQQPSVGVALVHGGGPTPNLETAGQFEGEETRFDVISFDQRGIGKSTPLNCKALETEVSALHLGSEDKINAFVQQKAEKARLCADKYPDYFYQLGSMNVVHDIELMRQALRVEKISFLGKSYGTRLAALYLQT